MAHTPTSKNANTEYNGMVPVDTGQHNNSTVDQAGRTPVKQRKKRAVKDIALTVNVTYVTDSADLARIQYEAIWKVLTWCSEHPEETL